MVVGGRSRGRWTRLGFAVQVLVALVLAVLVAGMVVHVAEWRTFRWRTDLTADAENTLDPQTEELLAGLEEPVTVDVFFRPASFEHVREVTRDAQQRMRELLFVAKNLVPGALEVRENDLYDLAATQGRMDELGIDQVQSVVVSRGDRRAVLRLFDEIAEVDPGDPNPRSPQPATLTLFRGEEALAEAIKKVTATDEPHVVFVAGHGEADPFGSDERGLSSLSGELERQGFRISTWKGDEDGPVPADTTVLALLAPAQPLSEREVQYVDGWVRRGGRLVVATEAELSEDPGSASALLRRYGMLSTRGIVCLPVLDYLGNLREGTPECADFRVGERQLGARHPVTEPLVERERRVRFTFTRSFDLGAAPDGGLLLELAASPPDSWRDLPPPGGGSLNFALDSPRESTGRFRLALSATFPAAAPDPGGDAEAAAEDGRSEARVIGIASPFFFSNGTFATNRDFALNAFNWLAERDFNVGVSPRDPEESTIDLSRGSAMAVVFHTSLWGIPGICGLLGLVTFVRRRRH